MVDIRSTMGIGRVLGPDLVRQKILWLLRIHTLLLILLLLPNRAARSVFFTIGN